MLNIKDEDFLSQKKYMNIVSCYIQDNTNGNFGIISDLRFHAGFRCFYISFGVKWEKSCNNNVEQIFITEIKAGKYSFVIGKYDNEDEFDHDTVYWKWVKTGVIDTIGKGCFVEKDDFNVHEAYKLFYSEEEE